MAQQSHPLKPDRSRIDLSDGGIAKQWVKKLGKSKEEIATAIAKVGDNAETVMKELRPRLAEQAERNTAFVVEFELPTEDSDLKPKH
jgi:hypothetical protein